MDAVVNYEGVRKLLHAYVEVFYSQVLIKFGEIVFPSRRIMHIVKRRRDGGKTPEEIKWLFDQIPLVITDCDFEVLNKNQRKYPASTLRVKGSVVVVVKKINANKEIVTAFTRNRRGIAALEKKKLQKSATGETPRPQGRSSH